VLAIENTGFSATSGHNNQQILILQCLFYNLPLSAKAVVAKIMFECRPRSEVGHIDGTFRCCLYFRLIMIFGSLNKQTYAESNWNGTVLAESDRTEVVEIIITQLMPLTANTSKTAHAHNLSPKGVACYYNRWQVNKDAAWYYPTAKDKAKKH